MSARQVVTFAAICLTFCFATPGKMPAPQQKPPTRLYNTAKQKLREGKQIVGATIYSPDPNTPALIFCGSKCSTVRSRLRT